MKLIHTDRAGYAVRTFVGMFFTLVFLTSGCGPSDGKVLDDFRAEARRCGIPFLESGNLNVVKCGRTRVDGVKREVWKVNYDIPCQGSQGKRIWCTAHVGYKNDGSFEIIRTDKEGVVGSDGKIESLNVDPLKYNRK